MKRLKMPKEKKVRVNITLDQSIYVEYGLYINNLSGFINKTLKNYIEKCKQIESINNSIDTNSNYYVKKALFNKKGTQTNVQVPVVKTLDDEPLDPQYKWWE